jgi:glycosyltransferase involved in cell wall biosynthesis
MKISVVMPCLNEKQTIVGCVTEALAATKIYGSEAEVIVADNGSTDGSVGLAAKAGARVINVPTRGYGAALKAGIEASQGTYVVMGDADGSYDFSEIPNFMKSFVKGNEIVIGNRFSGGIVPGAMPFLNQYLGNPAITLVTKILHGKTFGDTQCGLRGGTKEALQALNLQSDQFEFASEMVVKALRSNFKLAEIPIKLRLDATDRKPHLRPWRDGIRHMKLILREAINSR